MKASLADVSSADQGGEKLAGHNSRAANSEVANAADFSDSSPEWPDTREFLGVCVSSF